MKKIIFLLIAVMFLSAACRTADVKKETAAPQVVPVVQAAVNTPVPETAGVKAEKPQVSEAAVKSKPVEAKKPVVIAQQNSLPDVVNLLMPAADIMQADFGLNEENITEVQEALGNKMPVKSTYTLYTSKTGVVVMEEQMGKWAIIKMAILIDPAAKTVKKIEIISMNEKRGAGVKQGNFLGQFTGKAIADLVEINKGIRAVSGATVSSKTVFIAAKRALAVYEIFTRGGSPKAGAPAAPVMGKPAKTDGPVHSSPETIALIKAAEEGNTDEVIKQLSAGADINGKTMDSLQVTPLMKAAEKSQTAIVKLLLEKGANVNIISRFGFTALMFAADSGKKESVQALLAAGADVSKVGHMYATALNWSKTDEVRAILIKAGAK